MYEHESNGRYEMNFHVGPAGPSLGLETERVYFLSLCVCYVVVLCQVIVSGPQQSVPLDRPPGSASQTQGSGQLLQPAAGALPPELCQR